MLNLIFTNGKGFVLGGGLGEEFSPSRSGVWGDCGTPHVFGTFSKKVQRKMKIAELFAPSRKTVSHKWLKFAEQTCLTERFWYFF
ncbi:hypothetical protein H9X85_12775 [Anaerotignum lactatifermentans]|uniref:Uncharacterized protein n=1 Tax=Anaerotignum lactatifermentans TaxID=160404 RepID=A0ABS2GBZ0_9FIRM|nr:hypothetical protein [Anaerotignum lactatifermentans]MBM6879011.1 hypothetical protein [Anaerotignum lactatifermentans]MBM6952045.1 hypothetical protein [Anaerotignum lactatifermentans]